MNVDGDPSVNVRLNVTGSGGAFAVKNNTTSNKCFEVRDDGSASLFGDVDRGGTVVLNNSDPGVNVVLAKL